MTGKKKILAINGSASSDSSNLKVINRLQEINVVNFDWMTYDDLTVLPHFNPQIPLEDTPDEVIKFRDAIASADGVLICTPEYVFSIPSGLKNALEWCVSTTVFSGKPVGLITASANGQKAHEELQLIMKTIETIFNKNTTLLISGIKGKVDKSGKVIDTDTEKLLLDFSKAMNQLVFE